MFLTTEFRSWKKSFGGGRGVLSFFPLMDEEIEDQRSAGPGPMLRSQCSAQRWFSYNTQLQVVRLGKHTHTVYDENNLLVLWISPLA